MSRDPVTMQALSEGCDGVSHVLRLVSGAPGPHVLVNAMSHGNEPCGLAALRLILDHAAALCRGSITLVLANPAAALAPATGGGLGRRSLERDFNRLWAEAEASVRADGPESAELARARALLPIYRRADILLDIHSLATPGDPLLLYHPTPCALRLAAGFPRPLTHVRFARPLHDGTLLVEQSRFRGAPGRAAFVLECGHHDDPLSAAVAASFAARLLRLAGSWDAGAVPEPAWPVPSDHPGLVLEAQEMLRPSGEGFRFLLPLDGVIAVPDGATYAADNQTEHVAPWPGTAIVLPRERPFAGAEAGLLARRIHGSAAAG
jgi:predicted deacylase